jgi:succinyl-CoA synthetase beta subunit
MNVHEYQAKKVLKDLGIPVPEERVAENLEEVRSAVKDLGLESAVLKVQVHAGGRGKAGGVKIAKGLDEILAMAEQLLGMKVVTKQTGASGLIAHKILVSPTADIEKEYYVGAIIDREKARPVLIVSPDGGVNIEEVAEKTPERLMTQEIALDGTLKRFQLGNLVRFMGWEGDVAKQGMKIFSSIAKAFLESDSSTLEINPLILTKDQQLLAIDARMAVDENALFRQKEIASFYDPTQQNAQEVEAKKYDLAYIALEGEIGCMVNGAGLAMATMDIINHFGKKPANFLDVGGSASKEKVTAAFRIILSDSNVKAILVNIFGGIMNCATIAEGIVAAAKEENITVPLVVRLEGTNVERGKEIINKSGLKIISADSLKDAAKKAVQEVEKLS